MERKELCREKFCAVGMEDLFPHPVPETFALKDLQDLPLLGYRRWERIIQDTCRKQGFTLYFRCLADDARSCLQWAQAGLGVALVPESVVNLSQGLTAVPIQEQALESQVCLVRKKDGLSTSPPGCFGRIIRKQGSFIVGRESFVVRPLWVESFPFNQSDPVSLNVDVDRPAAHAAGSHTHPSHPDRC